MEVSFYKSPRVEEAYSRHGDELFRLAYSILLSREDAMDAVQDVFIKYIKNPPSFREYQHERAWFVRVTINHSRDLLRRRKIRSYTQLDDIAEIPAAESESGEVLKSVLSLPEKYRISILLHYFEGYSVEEISKILKVGNSAVKMRLARGRDMLRGCLGGESDLCLIKK